MQDSRSDVMANDPNCLFCRIVRGEIPSQVVYETPNLIAIRDINPQAPVHAVIIPRQHIATLNDVVDPTVVGHMSLAAATIARRDGLADRGYRTVMNTNADGGQTVWHIHMHLLAGRKLGWPPG
jgi:histidine triad (HIT) family protein